MYVKTHLLSREFIEPFYFDSCIYRDLVVA
jgi:hypothetical protein